MVEKIALITGSTGGIGKGIAYSLAKNGALVIITSRDINNAKNVANDINSSGGKASAFEFNLEKKNNIRKLINNIITKHGRLDILVNNALARSVLPMKEASSINHKEIEDCININLTNTISLTINCFNELKKTKGSVLNIGSVIVNRYIFGLSMYNILKGAIVSMTKSLASEWADSGIRVNQINPGFVLTDTLSNQIPKEWTCQFVEYFKKVHPSGRIGEPIDIGNLASFILSDEASWMTGAIIDIDGGYSVQGLPPIS